MLEFYEAAVAIIPVFLLTLVLQTQTISSLVQTRMELEETQILFCELRAGRVTDRQWLLDLGWDETKQVEQPNWLNSMERKLRWFISLINVLAYGSIVSAFVALGTSLGALFAGGAPWPVSLLVWPGLVMPALVLAALWCSSVGQKMAIAAVAARKRLESVGIVAPSPVGTRFEQRQAEFSRVDMQRRAVFREVAKEFILDE